MHADEMVVNTKLFNELVEERKQAIGILMLAVKYLDHPDVQALPFALPASVVAKKAHDMIDGKG